MIKYKAVSAVKQGDLEKRVNLWISRGYVLQGGISSSFSIDGRDLLFYYSQALIKEE